MCGREKKKASRGGHRKKERRGVPARKNHAELASSGGGPVYLLKIYTRREDNGIFKNPLLQKPRRRVFKSARKTGLAVLTAE